MAIDLIFVIPVRHHESVPNWQAALSFMEETILSIDAQTTDNWECRIVANTGSPLPALPSKFSARYIDIPCPERQTLGVELSREALRQDKGLRVYEAIRDIDPSTYIMIVDYDDYVSRNIASFVSARSNAAGWYLSRGYIYDGSPYYFVRDSFHMLCGTSHIVRRDHYGNLETANGQADIEKLKRRLGSHISINTDLAEEGTPLHALPFAGAVYRLGNPQATSGTGGLFRFTNPIRRLRYHPIQYVRNLTRYRPMSRAIAEEFSLRK